MPRKLPPLNAVRAFDASARQGGFVAAARELGVTPAAISLQIKKLEAFYETALFHRHASGIELTEIGAAIHADCMAALATLESTSDIAATHLSRSRIIISCIPSLADRWLMGKIADLAALRGDTRIELRAESDPVDLDHNGIDIRISYGLHLYPNHRGSVLFTDKVLPLCTPAFCQSAGIVSGRPDTLLDVHLIHTWWSPRFIAYPGWEDWFAAVGMMRVPLGGISPCVNMPSHAVDFALAGLGVALAQQSLALAELADGRLIAPFNPTVAMPEPYAIIVSPSARHKAGVTQAAHWLKVQAASLA